MTECEGDRNPFRGGHIRTFSTGATRSSAEGKPEYAGYLHPSVIKAFGAYMLKHQTQADGTQRLARNHKKGIPLESYMQSMFRHFMDVWDDYEKGNYTRETVDIREVESVMALLFNVMGFASVILDDDDN